MKIGIVGNGFVGKATAGRLEGHELFILDPPKGMNDDISNCDIVFVCINETDPSMENLNKVVENLVKQNERCFFVIRTTVIPGTTDYLSKKYNREFVFMPEFLREWNAKYDTKYPDKVVIGTEHDGIFRLLSIYFECKNILQVKPIEAELAKLALNSLATIKVVFAEELFDLAKTLKADYKNIYKIFQYDQNINERHLLAGKDGYRGADGKCVTPETKIYINNNIKKASEVNKGDKVLTIDGSWQRIIKKYCREIEEDIYRIRPQGLNEFCMTGEHPVWGIKADRKYYGNKREKLTNYTKKDYKFEWIEAKELKKGDFIALPKIKESHNKVFNDNLMRLFGYHVAEGNIEKNSNRIAIAFHKKEKEYIDDVCRIIKKEFGITPGIEKRQQNCTVIRFVSQKAKDILIANCGEMANKKELSNEVMNSQNINEFLIGYFRGDGSKSTNIYSIATISEKLFYQLKLILLRLGIAFTINIKEARIDKNEVNHQKVFTIRIRNYEEIKKFNDIIKMEINKELKLQRKTSWFDDEYLYIPIKSIEKIKYKGEVYNFEVDKNQTYVIADAIVHNCLPKDSEFLAETGKIFNSRMSLLETAVAINKIMLRMKTI